MDSIIAIYIPVFALLFVFLSVNVIRTRRREKVGLGSGGNVAVERAMRVHANFSEYVPITLLLLLILEQSGGNSLLLHALFVVLLAGRVIHAWGGVSAERELHVSRFRDDTDVNCHHDSLNRHCYSASCSTRLSGTVLNL